MQSIVWPLVKTKQAACPPIINEEERSIQLLETCPASYWKRVNTHQAYKGRSIELEASRAELIQVLEAKFPLKIKAKLKQRLLKDSGGDALDSLVCALIVWEHHSKLYSSLSELPEEVKVEGWVYF